MGKTNHLFLRDSKYPEVGQQGRPWTKVQCIHLLRWHMGHTLDSSVFFSFSSDGCTQTTVCPRCGLASLFPSTLISALPRQLWPFEFAICFPAGAQNTCIHRYPLLCSHSIYLPPSLKVYPLQDTFCVYSNPHFLWFLPLNPTRRRSMWHHPE